MKRKDDGIGSRILGISRCNRVVEIDATTVEKTREYREDDWNDRQLLAADPRWNYMRDMALKESIVSQWWKDLNCFCCKHVKKIEIKVLGRAIVLYIYCNNPTKNNKDKIKGDVQHRAFVLDLQTRELEDNMKHGFKYCYPDAVLP